MRLAHRVEIAFRILGGLCKNMLPAAENTDLDSGFRLNDAVRLVDLRAKRVDDASLSTIFRTRCQTSHSSKSATKGGSTASGGAPTTTEQRTSAAAQERAGIVASPV